MDDAVRQLAGIFEQSGLGRMLRISWNELREMDGRAFAKLQFEQNPWLLSSMEIWPTAEGRYLRIHYSEKIAPKLREVICSLPGSQSRGSDPRVGINLDGDFLVIAATLAGALHAIHVYEGREG